MDIKKLTKAATRAWSAGQIAATIATTPLPPDGSTNLTKQYSSYAKHVKLSDINREIKKTTTNTYTPTPALDRRTAGKLRK